MGMVGGVVCVRSYARQEATAASRHDMCFPRLLINDAWACAEPLNPDHLPSLLAAHHGRRSVRV